MSYRRGLSVGLRSGSDLQNMSSSINGRSEENLNVNMAIESIGTNCQLIDSQTEHLHRTRQRCTPTALLAQDEVRSFEEKLLKLFSLQLRTKRALPAGIVLPDDIKNQPSIKQWLEIIGLNKDAVKRLCCHLHSIEELLVQDATSLRLMADQCEIEHLQKHKFVKAATNLRNYTESQLTGKNEPAPGTLSWDSWELCNYRGSSSHRASVSSSDGESGSGNSDSSAVASASSSLHSNAISLKGSNTSSSPSKAPPHSPSVSSPSMLSAACSFQDKYTPPPTPPIILKSKVGIDKKFPSTPPPSKKNLLQASGKQPPTVQVSQDSQQQLGRSTSHESRLSLRLDSDSDAKNDASEEMQDQASGGRRSRLQSDSEVCKPGKPLASDDESDYMDIIRSLHKKYQYEIALKENNSDLSAEATEPSYNVAGCSKMQMKTLVQGSMGHNVQHRFTRTLRREVCGLCKKRLNFAGGLRCKDCSFFSHRDCRSKVAPSCGLHPMMLAYFINEKERKLVPRHLLEGYPMNLLSFPTMSVSQPSINDYGSQTSDSSTSSSGSSSPGSPVDSIPVLDAAPEIPHQSNFSFQDFERNWNYNINVRYGAPLPNRDASAASQDSEKTLSNNSGSGSTGTDDSEKTVAGRVDSQDSNASDGDGSESRCNRQNSVTSVSQSNKEWDIIYDEIDNWDLIGKGRFSTVYKGYWHGDIAIKQLNLELVNDEKTLRAFKDEVTTFCKTRHDNLSLFMGFCMKPPRFAIITSMIRGYSLYRHIHIMKERFSMARTIPIARQIMQGMSYLHGRGIIHKDVKSKNIFLEGEKVVITDFGLFNVSRVYYRREFPLWSWVKEYMFPIVCRNGDWLSIPHGWLCYLAPELIRNLRMDPHPDDGLPFTPSSDVFAFGTVWYELLCGEWPHRNFPPETVIWQVGRGMKPSLAHLQASRNLKDILMWCWNYTSEQRPEFSSLLDKFNKLPQKRLDRSPSHPIQLSRSAESVF